jgi:hypothetical protein
MKKIRIPRKLKKYCADILFNSWKNFPNVPKLERYMSYFTIECGMKIHNMSAEDLCRTFGKYTKDDVVWWNWVRWKELGIEPKMSADIQEYWDYFVEKGVINKITK